MSAFLDSAGWGDAVTEPLAGDASARRYSRLRRGAETAILMQDPDGDVSLFARLARHLLGLGLSAPRVLAEAHGLLLLEDLGDGLIARLATEPGKERGLYLTATDALVALHLDGGDAPRRLRRGRDRHHERGDDEKEGAQTGQRLGT